MDQSFGEFLAEHNAAAFCIDPLCDGYMHKKANGLYKCGKCKKQTNFN